MQEEPVFVMSEEVWNAVCSHSSQHIQETLQKDRDSGVIHVHPDRPDRKLVGLYRHTHEKLI